MFEQLSKYGQHLVALADLDLETGLRLGEWLNARWRDHMNDVLNVWQTKTDRPRTMPLTAKAQSILRGLNTRKQLFVSHQMPDRARFIFFDGDYAEQSEPTFKLENQVISRIELVTH